MPAVLISPPEFNQKPGPHCDTLLAAGMTPFYAAKALNLFDAQHLHAVSRDVEAVLAGTEPWNEFTIDGSKLRVIARLGVGFDSVDIAAATRRNILVTITPGVVEDSVAELTVGLLLCLTRNLLARDRAIRQGGWDRVIGPRMAGRIPSIRTGPPRSVSTSKKVNIPTAAPSATPQPSRKANSAPTRSLTCSITSLPATSPT